ncbi:MAG: phosphoenolpyruvate--protein phosphotransferase [Elusimicrobiota bacterium]
MNKKKVNKIVKGLAVNPGIATGKVYLHKELDLSALRTEKLEIESVEDELSRLDKAVKKSRHQLKGIEKKFGTDSEGELEEIFKAQAQMLKDPGFLENIRNRITEEKVNIEYVISGEINKIKKKFKTLDDEKLKSTFMDIQDTYNRLIRNILDLEHIRTNPFKRINEPVIMVAHNILPSDIAIPDSHQILGFVIEEGSLVSHAAIIAKTMGVPAVLRTSGITNRAGADDRILVDGFKGEVVLNPTEKEIKDRRDDEVAMENSPKQESTKTDCITENGEKITLEANISTLEEARLAQKNGTDGVGLLRSEFFYMSRNTIPQPEDETKFYKEVLQIFKNKPVTFRLLDIGSDKTIAELPSAEENNPQLGIRGIRYLLKYPKIMRRQLKCLMRAAQNTEELRILLPFVTIKEDVENVKKTIKIVADANNFDMNKLKIGIMVEIPSVALDIKNYLDSVDFLSVGTNDLIQYLFAVSREDGGLNLYRNDRHPVLINLLYNVIKNAQDKDIPVSICGEMAGNPETAKILIENGARSLSMRPRMIPRIKEKLSS